jgi:hypothetical protein
MPPPRRVACASFGTLGFTLAWALLCIIMAFGFSTRRVEDAAAGRFFAAIALIAAMCAFGVWGIVLLSIRCVGDKGCFKSRAVRWTLAHLLLSIGPLVPMAMGAQIAWYDGVSVYEVKSAVQSIPFLPRDVSHEQLVLPAQSVMVWPAYRIDRSRMYGRNFYQFKLMPMLSPTWAQNTGAVLRAARGEDGAGQWTKDDWGAGVLVWVNNYEQLNGWSSALETSSNPVSLPASHLLNRLSVSSRKEYGESCL